MPIPLKPNRRTLLTLTACLLITGTACNRPEYEGEDPTKIVGDWKLQYFKESFLGTSFPFTHVYTSVPSDEYTLHIGKNGKICSRKNGDRIWHDRITRAKYFDISPEVEGYVDLDLEHFNSQRREVFMWFVGDTLFCPAMPLPPVDCDLYPNWCDRIAVYLPE